MKHADTTLAQDRAADSYNLPALNSALAQTPFAGNLHHFAEIDSTNTHAMQQGAAGAPHGSVYLADAQTAGRGRGAHTWSSPPASGLYVSILLRPKLDPGDALWCSLAAGLATLTAIQNTTTLTPDLRWPNDILIGPRKLAGILTEMHAEATRVRHLVIGIGINVHQPHFPLELAPAATSLAIEGDHPTRSTLLLALLTALNHEVTALTANDPGTAQHSLMTRLEAASTWIRGKSVIVDEGQAGAPSTFAGLTAGLDERGFLQVQTEYGLRTVLSGGVREA
jgi:BirA family biotin operon repressor/biotin-[acetyl-CoA-carboxylase] ligase